MGKRTKMGCLPSTSKVGSGDPGPGQGGGFHEDLTTGSGNGGHVDPADPAPDAYQKRPQPLNMPEILANIFKFLPPELLPSIRLVSKAWEAESLKAWRSWATLQFHYPGGKEILLSSGGKDGAVAVMTTLGEFLNFWKANCSRKPFRRFNLSRWEFSMGGAKATTKGYMTDRFWKLTGSNMTSLILRDCFFSGAKVFRKIIFEACPNLQELTLDGCSYNRLYRDDPVNAHLTLAVNESEYQEPEDGELVSLQSISICLKELWAERSPFPPVSWLELLSHFPALKVISMTFELSMHIDHRVLLQQLVDAIKSVRTHDGGKLPLRKVRIHVDPLKIHLISNRNYGDSPGILQLFQEVNIPLELNALCLNLSQDDMILAMETIASSSPSLRKLEALNEIRDLGNVLWDFPFDTELRSLESLKMSHRFCRSMKFLKYTPNLKELVVTHYRQYQHEGPPLDTHLVSQTIKWELADVKLLNLKEFYFNFELKDADLRSLTGWLPNVETLAMHLTDSQFAIVCDQWRNLEHLHILGRGLTDEGITGRRRRREQTGEGNGTDEILPNISYLTGLKCFRILYGMSELTDVSAFEGFLKLPALQILRITSSNNNFGDEAYSALHSKIPTCELSSGFRLYNQIGVPNPTCPDFRCDHFFPS